MLRHYPLVWIVFLAIIVLLGLGLLDPIPQDLNYHNFADVRTLFSVPNFWNVFSNLPFLLVGIYALYQMLRLNAIALDGQMKKVYVFFFVGVSLVAFGSAYYHLEPNNHTLIWDRLPMVVAFMSLLTIVIAEFLSEDNAKKLLYPLLTIGISSVVYWVYTESVGEGDVRLYFFVQFFPMIVIPVLLLKFKSAYTLHQGYWYLIGAYILAKLFEYYDEPIYDILRFISGHSLKHIVASFGLFVLVRTFIQRTKLNSINNNIRSIT